jgi:hypothetical protein
LDSVDDHKGVYTVVAFFTQPTAKFEKDGFVVLFDLRGE